MRRINYLLYLLLHCTWGLPQTLAGFILFLGHIDKAHIFYHGSILTTWNRSDGISLGLFIFVPGQAIALGGYDKRMAAHEYGHTIQSLVLGPLYLPLVGIISFLWSRLDIFKRIRKKKNLPYSYCFTESWADKLGGKFTG